MLNLSVNLIKSGKKYKATLVAEEHGKVLHTEDWGVVDPKNKLTRRIKIVQLNGKNLGIVLNVLNSSHDKKVKKEKVTKCKTKKRA